MTMGGAFGVERQDGTSSFFVDDVARVDIDIAVINDGNWHQVVGVADSTAGLLRLYVDGIELAIGAYDGPLKAVNPTPLCQLPGARAVDVWTS